MIDIIISILARAIEIFAAPFMNFELLWVVIPVYFQWFLTSTFQEKKETAFGNAMVNGFVCMWVGLDWSKTLYQEIVEGSASIEAFRLILSIALIIYGLFIFIQSFRGRRIVKYIGRVREVYYFIIVLTPIFYTIVPVDLITIGAILLGLPISYLVSGLFARYVPYPRGEIEQSEEEKQSLDSEPDDTFSSPTDPFSKKEDPFASSSDQNNNPQNQNNNSQISNNTQSYNCPSCGSPLDYIPQYKRYFCRRCNKYV
jgi:hypothetical protein